MRRMKGWCPSDNRALYKKVEKEGGKRTPGSGGASEEVANDEERPKRESGRRQRH